MTAAPAAYAVGCIASVDPLVTVSKCEAYLRIGLASSRPDILADDPIFLDESQFNALKRRERASSMPSLTRACGEPAPRLEEMRA